jgi:hypothetical protein
MTKSDLYDIRDKLDAYKVYLRDVRIQEAWAEICNDHGSGTPEVASSYTVYFSDGFLSIKKDSKDLEREASERVFFSKRERTPSFSCVFSSCKFSCMSDDISALFYKKSFEEIDMATHVKGACAKNKALMKLKRNLSRLRAADQYSNVLEKELAGFDNKEDASVHLNLSSDFKSKSKKFVKKLCDNDDSSGAQILFRAIMSCLGFIYCAPKSMSYGCSFWSRTRHDQIKTKIDLTVPGPARCDFVTAA